MEAKDQDNLTLDGYQPDREMEALLDRTLAPPAIPPALLARILMATEAQVRQQANRAAHTVRRIWGVRVAALINVAALAGIVFTMWNIYQSASAMVDTRQRLHVATQHLARYDYDSSASTLDQEIAELSSAIHAASDGSWHLGVDRTALSHNLDELESDLATQDHSPVF